MTVTARRPKKVLAKWKARAKAKAKARARPIASDDGEDFASWLTGVRGARDEMQHYACDSMFEWMHPSAPDVEEPFAGPGPVSPAVGPYPTTPVFAPATPEPAPGTPQAAPGTPESGATTRYSGSVALSDALRFRGGLRAPTTLTQTPEETYAQLVQHDWGPRYTSWPRVRRLIFNEPTARVRGKTPWDPN